MKGQFFDVNLQGEAPLIGSGWRLVFVHSVGAKSVKVRSVETFAAATIAARRWNELAKCPITVRPALLKKRIKAYRAAGHAVTKAIKEMMP